MKKKTGLTRHDFLEIIISVYLCRVLFSFPFAHLPMPWHSHRFWAAAVFGSFILLYPKAYISKKLIPLYVFFAIRLFFIPLLWINRYHAFLTENPRIPSVEGFIYANFPLFIALLVYFYYIERNDYNRLSKLIRRTWFFTFCGVINQLIVLILFPRAMIDMVRAGVIYEGLGFSEYLANIGFQGYGFFNALSSVFPIFIYLIVKINMKFFHKLFWMGFTIITWFVITRGWVTAFLLFSTLFALVALFVKEDYMKDLRRFVFIIVIIILLPTSFKADILYKSSEYFPDSKIGLRLYDAGQTIENPDLDYYSSTQHAGRRLGRTPLLWRSFLSNPIIGSGLDSQHVAWLDMLSMYGLLGSLPWFYLVLKNFRNNLMIIPKAYSGYYMLCIVAFVSMGLLKDQGGAHVFLFWFLIVPASGFLYVENVVEKVTMVD